jgi:hypothetical protein
MGVEMREGGLSVGMGEGARARAGLAGAGLSAGGVFFVDASNGPEAQELRRVGGLGEGVEDGPHPPAGAAVWLVEEDRLREKQENDGGE